MFGQKKRFSTLAITFGTGAIAGAVVALLFAPMKGKALQRKIANATGDVLGKVNDTVESVQDTTRRLVKA